MDRKELVQRIANSVKQAARAHNDTNATMDRLTDVLLEVVKKGPIEHERVHTGNVLADVGILEPILSATACILDPRERGVERQGMVIEVLEALVPTR